jgi:hypothetical protein
MKGLFHFMTAKMRNATQTTADAKIISHASHELIYRDREEFCFEEVIAKRRGIKFGDFAPCSSVSVQLKCVNTPSIMRNPLSSMLSPISRRPKTFASPTINTKLANEDIADMFKACQSDSSAEDPDFTRHANENTDAFYYATDEETISRQVYKPQAAKMKIFCDGDSFETSTDIKENSLPQKLSRMAVFSDDAEGNTTSADHFTASTSFAKHITATPAPELRLNRGGFNVSVMTPLTEKTETSRRYSAKRDDTVDTQYRSFLRHEDTIMEGIETLQEEECTQYGSLSKVPEEALKNFDTLAEDEMHEQLSFENPCDPADADIVNAIMRSVEPPEDAELLLCLSKESTVSMDILKGSQNVLVADSYTCTIQSKLFDNLYSKLYIVDCQGNNLALKVNVRPSAWEYFILYRIHARINCVSIPWPICCDVYSNESLLLTEALPEHSLADALTISSGTSFGAYKGGLEEVVCMFWILRLLELVEQLKSAEILHNNINIGFLY